MHPTNPSSFVVAAFAGMAVERTVDAALVVRRTARFAGLLTMRAKLLSDL